MSSLLYLSEKDFKVVQGPEGSTLCNGVKGFFMVLYYSKECVHCHSFMPIFKKIPHSVSGCQFGLVNVTQNPNMVKMSEKTISPIQYVPYIILYVNGKPFLRYDGPRTEEGVKNFIMEVSKKLDNKKYFTQTRKKKAKPEDKIPPYCIARPKCEGDVCYLSYDKAYG